MLKLDQKLKRVEIKNFELDNDIVFTYFDNLPSSERDDKFIRALYIGVLAMMEDRFSAFLSKTSNELGTELESLKMIFEMKKEVFYKSTIKGTLAEDDIADFLNEYFKSKRMKDVALLTGNSAGELPRNKTGDIICEINGENNLKIAIECKFDKSVKQVERGIRQIYSLVDNSILKFTDSVGYIPEVGFVSIVDSQKGDYSNLIIAYMLARDIAINARNIELDKDVLAMLVTRIIKDINEITTIKALVERNIENNKDILKQIEKSMLLMDFNQKYLTQFLQTGTLTKKDLLDFYSGVGVKDQYKLIEKDINEY